MSKFTAIQQQLEQASGRKATVTPVTTQPPAVAANEATAMPYKAPNGTTYDSGEFKTVFLRPVMRSAKDTSLEAHFVLQPA